MQIIKASGEKETFSSKKIYHSILEAGASKKLAKETTNLIKTKIHNESTTEEILNITLKNLKKEPGVAEKYNLKRAIMNLGPAGYAFENYFSEILNAYGYRTQTGIHLKGKIIQHEVDILAERQKKFMIECKYHNEKGIYTKLQPALAAYARFLDLERHKIDQPWLVTNTKCSLDAVNYAKGVNLKITSWMPQHSAKRGTPSGDPENDSLQHLIENKKLYPITVLFLKESTRAILLQNKIVMLKSLIEIPTNELSKLTNLPIKELEKIKDKAREILA